MSFPFPRLFLLLTVLLGLSGCGDGEKGAANAAPPPPPVATLRLELKAVPLVFDAVGQTEGSREIEVRARVSGILEKRVYNEGESVKAGAILFRIDRAPFEIALRQARATLAEEQARQEQARRDVDRLHELAEERAIGQREYEQSVATYKQSTAAISGAEASVSEAQLNLSYTTVTAPIDGITGRALRSEGSLLTANTDNALLTTLTQVDPIWVRFSLSSTEYERLRGTRARAEVRLLNQDGSVAASDGRLNFAASTVDRALGTVQMRAEFRNTGMRWLPGQYVKTQVLAGQQQAFLVPQAAVIQNEQGRAVWVVDSDNKVNPRPIQTANWIGSDWVVTGGVQAGEQIVIDNLMKLRPGVSVQPNAPAPSPSDTSPSSATPAPAR
ncbi:MAG TPA: efflux RND transporter periplasmic adaptor subunit [Burkholderiales bacterium]|nr:efflux RND transporter periplasmic adaptor subunit [Burkholderiales bacterium]